MYLMGHEEARRKLGDRACDEIDCYTRAVEEELRRYEFGARATVFAEVQYAPRTVVEYPKLFVHLRSAPVHGDRELHVTAGVTVRELTAMVRKDIPDMNMALFDHVYLFAQKLLTTLVLTRRPREMTGTGRTPTEPELQNIPTPLTRGKRRETGFR